MHTAAMNETGRLISAVTLNHEWPKLERLLLTVFFSCFGGTMNGFFVASFFVEDYLKKIGLVFLAFAGIADLIVSCGVIPTSAVVLLSGEWDTDSVCYALQFLTISSTYSYSLFYSMVAIETYCRLCRGMDEYDGFTSTGVSLIGALIFMVSFTTAGIGVYLGLDYDCCLRQHYGNFNFRIATNVVFHLIPGLIIVFCFISASVHMRRRAKEQGHYRRSEKYEGDKCGHHLNIFAYVLFVASWLPYLVVVHQYPGTTDSRFYHSVWLGVGRSVITSFLYGTMDRSFRRAFAHLFNYCCCKSTLSGSFASRHRRAYQYKSTGGDVRVHIMHQVINPNSPQRASSSTRETQEL